MDVETINGHIWIILSCVIFRYLLHDYSLFASIYNVHR